jgi:hypothetical protein
MPSGSNLRKTRRILTALPPEEILEVFGTAVASFPDYKKFMEGTWSLKGMVVDDWPAAGWARDGAHRNPAAWHLGVVTGAWIVALRSGHDGCKLDVVKWIKTGKPLQPKTMVDTKFLTRFYDHCATALQARDPSAQLFVGE